MQMQTTAKARGQQAPVRWHLSPTAGGMRITLTTARSKFPMLVDSSKAPAIVLRYLQTVLPPTAPLSCTLEQTGRLRTKGESKRWMTFTAKERISCSDLSFVWDAKVKVAGPLHLQVLDCFAKGRGKGDVLLQSKWGIVSSRTSKQMDAGALHRLLAESVWCPALLVPSRRLTWRSRDALSATATLRSPGVEVELDFHFNDAAEVVRVYSPGRWGRFGSGFVKSPWEGHFSDYQDVEGVRIPRRGHVGWYGEAGWKCVWQGEVTKATFSNDATAPR